MRPGLTAAATLCVDAGVDAGPSGERQRMRWSQAWPVLLRPTGAEQVHLVHGAGGPLGGDDLALTVAVGPGARVAVRSAGATLVQPGVDPGPARWNVAATVAAGGRLDWAPEPTIVTDDADLAAVTRVDAVADGVATVREIVVLGRSGQRGGRYRGELVATVAGRVLLAHVTSLDGADPALSGPGGTAGARAVGSLLVVGTAGGTGAGQRPGVRWAWSPLAGPGALLLAVGDPGPVTALLDSEAAALTAQPITQP